MLNNDLSHFNFSLIVEYILCLPGSNASVERVFSNMNKIWSSEKTQLGVCVLKAILITKGVAGLKISAYNINM